MRFVGGVQNTVGDVLLVVFHVVEEFVIADARAVEGHWFSFVGGCGGRGVEVDIGVGSDVACLDGLGDLCCDGVHVHGDEGC